MVDDYKIHLNFLPILGQLPEFTVYRKLRSDPQEPRPEGRDIHAYSLPQKDSKLDNRLSHWVSLERRPDFDEFRVQPFFNHDLTQWVLFKALCERTIERLEEKGFWIPERGFRHEIHFCMRRHNEGEEQLVVQPYFLRVAKKFGFLIDFHFRMREGAKFS